MTLQQDWLKAAYDFYLKVYRCINADSLRQ